MGINSLMESAVGLAKEHTVLTALGASVVGAGVALGASSLVGASKKSSTRSVRKGNNRIKHTKRGWKQDRARFNRRQKWEVAYRKRKKSKSRKGVKYTKNGQPYIILASGKARFIKGKRRKK